MAAFRRAQDGRECYPLLRVLRTENFFVCWCCVGSDRVAWVAVGAHGCSTIVHIFHLSGDNRRDRYIKGS